MAHRRTIWPVAALFALGMPTYAFGENSSHAQNLALTAAHFTPARWAIFDPDTYTLDLSRLYVGSMLASYHYDRSEEFNEIHTPSLYLRVDWISLGFYENSYGSPSHFVGLSSQLNENWQLDVLLVDGYGPEATGEDTQEYEIQYGLSYTRMKPFTLTISPRVVLLAVEFLLTRKN